MEHLITPKHETKRLNPKPKPYNVKASEDHRSLNWPRRLPRQLVTSPGLSHLGVLIP